MNVRQGIALTVLSLAAMVGLGGGAFAVVRWLADAPEGRDGNEVVVRMYDVGDLADERYWPPGPPAVRMVASRHDEWAAHRGGGSGVHSSYPRVIDRRPRRLEGLADGVELVAAAAPNRNAYFDAASFGGTIALAATHGGHEQYAKLLQAIRAPGPGAAFTTVIAGDTAPTAGEDQEVEAKLAELVVEEFRLDRVTPEAAFQALAERTRTNILVDWPSTAGVGVERDTPAVTMHVWNLPLARVLDVLLLSASPYDDLDYRVEDGVIRITTGNELELSGVLRIYDVRQLLVDIHTSGGHLRAEFSGPPVTRPAPVLRAEDEEQRAMEEVVHELEQFILESVLAESWRNNGGTTGHLRTWSGRLLVYQTPEAHRQIERVLKTLSDEFGKDPARPASTSPAARTPPQPNGPDR